MSNEISIKAVERDRGLNKLRREVARLASQPGVKVGVVGDKASQDHGGITIGELAAVHEYGSPKNGIPQRSFIGSTMDANQGRILDAMGRGMGDVLEGGTSSAALLTRIGETQVNAIRERMRAGISPATQKNTHVPLIDTQKLLDAIGFELVPNSKGLK